MRLEKGKIMSNQTATQAPNPSGAKENKRTPTVFVSTESVPEWGGIAWTEMWGSHTNADGTNMKTFKINITGRGRTSKEAFANLVEMITDGKMSPEEFRAEVKLSLFQPVPDSKKTPEVRTQAVINNNPIANAPVAPQTPAAGPAVTGAPNILHIVAMDIVPRADGKVELKFFGNDKKSPRNQYADLSWVTQADKAVEKLLPIAGFTVAHFAAAASYELKCKLIWTPSDKLNRNNVPYKNVDHFEPA